MITVGCAEIEIKCLRQESLLLYAPNEYQAPGFDFSRY